MLAPVLAETRRRVQERPGEEADLQVTAGLEPLLKASGIVKRFPGVLAVDHLDLTVNPGEVIALLGQNGAGKSTVIQILAGVHPHGSYEGEITMNGRPFRLTNVSQAQALGLALVAQEVNVVPGLSVADYKFLT